MWSTWARERRGALKREGVQKRVAEGRALQELRTLRASVCGSLSCALSGFFFECLPSCATAQLGQLAPLPTQTLTLSLWRTAGLLLLLLVLLLLFYLPFLHNLCSAGASGKKRGKRKREGQLPYEFCLNMAKGISIACRNGNIYVNLFTMIFIYRLCCDYCGILIL